MNRFSRDLDVLDMNMPTHLRQWFLAVPPIFTTVILICYSTPIFTVIMVPLGVIFVMVQVSQYMLHRNVYRLHTKFAGRQCFQSCLSIYLFTWGRSRHVIGHIGPSCPSPSPTTYGPPWPLPPPPPSVQTYSLVDTPPIYSQAASWPSTERPSCNNLFLRVPNLTRNRLQFL